MKRFRSEKGTVMVTILDRKARRKGSSRTKAFDLIAATHPASRAAMQRSSADDQPRPEPGGSLLGENSALRGELEAALRRLGELERLSKVTEETAARLAAVEAESSELRGKLSARDRLVERLRTKAERTGSLLEEKRVLEGELQAARGWLGKLESRHAVLMSERDKLAAELKRRREQLAQHQKEAARSRAGTVELERLRGVARETQARLGTANVEALKLKAQVSARDRLLERLRERAARTSSLLGEKLTLKSDLQTARGRLAGLKAEHDDLSSELDRLRHDAEEAAARLAALEAESSELRAAVSARDELIDQLRAQAERASSLLDEKHILERDLQAARERLAERDDAAAELDRLRRTAEKTAARLAALQAESSELSAQVSAKDQLANELRIEARDRADLAAENARLRGKLAEADQQTEAAEAKFVALLAERNEFEAELAERGEGLKGVVDEIQAQAGRMDSVLDENHRLRCELRKRATRELRRVEAGRTGETTRISETPEEEADGPAT